MKKSELRKLIREEIQNVENENYEIIRTTPEYMQPGDFFLRDPQYTGEEPNIKLSHFTEEKEIKSVNYPDIEFMDGEVFDLSPTNLYMIKRNK